MDRENMAKRVLIYKMVLLVLFLIGSGLIAGGSWWVSNIKKIDKEYVSTMAKIENIKKYTSHHAGKNRKHYEVTVSYMANGKVYTEKLGAYSSSMNEGDSIQLKYNPGKPTDIRSLEVENVISMVMIIAGVLLLISDLFMPLLFRKLKIIE